MGEPLGSGGMKSFALAPRGHARRRARGRASSQICAKLTQTYYGTGCDSTLDSFKTASRVLAYQSCKRRIRVGPQPTP
jgi:hypothetical protein